MKTKDKFPRAVIFANGPVEDYQALRHLLKPSDIIVCADGGLRHADRLSLPPRVILGDMDSIEQNRLQELGSEVDILNYPSDKNETDLELALKWVEDNGCQQALVAGISGGRMDHTLANIHLMAGKQWHFELCFWERGQYAWVINDGQTVSLNPYQGYTLSLLPLTELVSGIVTKGLKFPLNNEQLEFGTTRGISNVVMADYASVSIDTGKLLLVVTLPGHA